MSTGSSTIREITRRERAAREELIQRAGLSEEDILTASRVLGAISDVDLADLIKAPGFNLLEDGEVGSANTSTPEWQHFSEMDAVRGQAGHLYDVLQDHWWHSLRGGT